MRVATYHSNHDLRVEEMPVPEVGEGELLVKVHASGICGSDVMEWYRIKKAPRVLGHEITGEIVGSGPGVEDYNVGDRVFVSHHVPCEECHYCRCGHTSVCDTLRTTNFYPGGFSEYIRVPKINVDKGVYILPDNMSYEQGVFIEPLACVVRGQRYLDMLPDHRTLVIGSGISGLLHVKLARAHGIQNITATDIQDYRLRIASEYADKVSKVVEDNSADRVIVCAGALSAMEQALKAVDRGGRILLFAPLKPEERLPLLVWDMWKNEVSLVTSYAASDGDIKEAMDLISSGNVVVDDMVTHEIPLSDIAQGFRLTEEGANSLKVVVKPQE